VGPRFTAYDSSVQQRLSMQPILFPFVIPSVPGFPTSPLLPATTYVVLSKENHMLLTKAATLDRKSGGGEGSAVPRTYPGDPEFYTQTELSSRLRGPTFSWTSVSGTLYQYSCVKPASGGRDRMLPLT
jgi:hypothetical protein